MASDQQARWCARRAASLAVSSAWHRQHSVLKPSSPQHPPPSQTGTTWSASQSAQTWMSRRRIGSPIRSAAAWNLGNRSRHRSSASQCEGEPDRKPPRLPYRSDGAPLARSSSTIASSSSRLAASASNPHRAQMPLSRSRTRRRTWLPLLRIAHSSTHASPHQLRRGGLTGPPHQLHLPFSR